MPSKRISRLESAGIPPEIWMKILREATLSANVHFSDAEPLGYIDTIGTLEERITKQRANLRLRSSIVRVCKRWNIWATPYLYESILLEKDTPLNSLERKLNASSREAKATSSDCIPLGRYTQRLDIAVPGLSDLSFDLKSSELPDEWKLIMAIMCRLTRLKIITLSDPQSQGGINNHTIIPHKIMLAISAIAGDSLRVFCHDSGVIIRQDSLVAFLLHTPNLRVLKLQDYLPIPFWNTWVECIDLPNLVELKFTQKPLMPRLFRFPTDSLRSFVIHDIYSETFMQSFGSALTHISLSYHSVQDQPHSFSDVVKSLQTLSPLLTHLHLLFQDLSQLPPHLRIPNTIMTTLEVTVTSPRGTHRLYTDFVTRLIQMTAGADGLKIMRFSDSNTISGMSRNHKKLLRGLLHSFDVKGTRVEDRDGYLIVA